MTSFSLAKHDETIDRASSTLMSCLVDQYKNLPEEKNSSVQHSAAGYKTLIAKESGQYSPGPNDAFIFIFKKCKQLKLSGRCFF